MKKNPTNKQANEKKQNYPKQDDQKKKTTTTKTSICVITVLDFTCSWRIDTKETFQWAWKLFKHWVPLNIKGCLNGYLGLNNQFTQYNLKRMLCIYNVFINSVSIHLHAVLAFVNTLSTKIQFKVATRKSIINELMFTLF